MRLAPLLAQFLYQHKRLDLPGLGTFIMDPVPYDETDSSKHAKTLNNEQVRFSADPSIKDSPELITFISAQTGKIKALAAADLESHLELAHQFLNIGKPFSFEGIGNVTRIKAGEYGFTPGPMISDFKKETSLRDNTNSAEETPDDYNYKNIFYPKQVKAGWKKPAAVFLLVAGLALAIWGGYEVYKRTTGKNASSVEEKIAEDNNPATKDEIVTTKDTTTSSVSDTLAKSIPGNNIKTNTPPPAGSYKFILETTGAPRAISRYNTLKTYQWPVQIETTDSQVYKIYMILPAGVSDTLRLRDSLSMLTGKKVIIEQ